MWTLHLNTSSGWKHQSIATTFLSTWNGLRQKWISKVYILLILVMCIRFLRISGICDFVKHISWEMSLWGKERNNFLHVIKAMWTVASAGINFIHNHASPHAPRQIFTKNLLPPWGFCNLAFVWGRGFVGAAPEGRAMVYKWCLLLEFSL